MGYIISSNLKDLSELMDTSEQWIVDRTGIEERRFANSNQGPSDLAIPASEEAIKKARINKNDIDFIIFATSTPDHYVPGSSCIFQDKMKIDDSQDLLAMVAFDSYMKLSSKNTSSTESNKLLDKLKKLNETINESL